MNITVAIWCYTAVQMSWIVAAAVWLTRRRDELPLITSLLLFYVFSFRLWALLEGWTAPVTLSNFGFADVEPESAVVAQGIAVLGQSVLLGIYMLVQRRRIDVPGSLAPAGLLRWVKPRVFALVAGCMALSMFARRAVWAQVADGRSMGFEVSSYMILFPLALVGSAILLGALWRAGGLTSSAEKGLALGIFALIASLTFGPSMRFQFLGWVLGVTIIFSSGQSLRRRLSVGAVGLLVALALFAGAGALRGTDHPGEEFQQQAWERFAYAHDANMLDGFVLLRQVYPDMLNYSYSAEHFEILTRPIPRAIWPDKPVGGYMNKLGIVTAETGFTLGISPSLIGSFFQEGGIPGVVLLSAIYGFVFARIVRFSTNVLPLTGMIIRGMTCAALVPLLRGGDLPGIYAWFGMSFWPIFLLFWLKRREFFQRIPFAPTGAGLPQPVAAPALPRTHAVQGIWRVPSSSPSPQGEGNRSPEGRGLA